MGQCCTSVVEAGSTLSHQWVSESGLLSYHRGWPTCSLRTPTCGFCELGIAANTRHWSDVKLIRGHRLRLHIVHRRTDLPHHITWWWIASWSNPATFTSILSIYKAFKNIWMIALNILGYFGRNKQNSYAALTLNCNNFVALWYHFCTL